MDFIIFYEHVNRELENISLIKHELEKRGYNVKISHFSGLSYGRYVLFTQPKVIVMPWLRTNENVYRFTRFRGKKHKLVNLQWEQIYSNKIVNSGLAVTKDKALEAFHFCWGENSRNRLIDQGVHPDNAIVTGGVHMDFCRSDFKDYYKTKKQIASEFDLNPDNSWVLYISSFSYATYNNESIKILEQNFNTSLMDIVNNAKESKKLTLEWIDALLCNNKKIVFIYRPHPSENIDETLKRLSKKQCNFKIINQYSVKQWISVSDRINTWFSTSVSEIYFMNKKCHIIRPIPIPEDIEVEIMRSATFVTDKETFVMLNSVINSDIDFPIEKNVMKSFYDQNIEIPSYIRTANYLEDIYLNHEAKEYVFQGQEEVSLRKKYRKQVVISLLVELVVVFHLRLSRVIPYDFKILKNLERWIEHKSQYKRMEEQIISFMREKI